MNKNNKLGLLNIVKSSNAKEKPLSIPKTRWNAEENLRAQKGMCVDCGQNPSCEKSFLCEACEALQSIEKIRDELALIKEKILQDNKPE